MNKEGVLSTLVFVLTPMLFAHKANLTKRKIP